MADNDKVELFEVFVDTPICQGHATLCEIGLLIHQAGSQELGIFIEPNNVLQVRELCNRWLEIHGARDTQGRLVIDPATEPK